MGDPRHFHAGYSDSYYDQDYGYSNVAGAFGQFSETGNNTTRQEALYVGVGEIPRHQGHGGNVQAGVYRAGGEVQGAGAPFNWSTRFLTGSVHGGQDGGMVRASLSDADFTLGNVKFGVGVSADTGVTWGERKEVKVLGTGCHWSEREKGCCVLGFCASHVSGPPPPPPEEFIQYVNSLPPPK